jgi:uncharacterized protein (DUF58 family)
MMSIRGYSILLAAAVLIGLSVALSNAGLAIMGASLASYVVASMMTGWIRKVSVSEGRIEVDRTVLKSMSPDGSLHLDVELTLTNRSMIPLINVEVTDLPPSTATPLESLASDLSIPRGKTRKSHYAADVNAVGFLQFNGTRLNTMDFPGVSSEFSIVDNRIGVDALPIFEMSRGKSYLRSVRSALKSLGHHSSIQVGIGSDFSSIRDYLPGDQFRMIEWKSTARRARLMTKETESERNIRVLFILDSCDTMLSGGRVQTKLDTAVRLISTLSGLLIADHDLIGLVVFSENARFVLPPSSTKSSHVMMLHRLLDLKNKAMQDALSSVGIDAMRKAISEYLAATYPSLSWTRADSANVVSALRSSEDSTSRRRSLGEERALLGSFAFERGLGFTVPTRAREDRAPAIVDAIKAGLTLAKDKSILVLISDFEDLPGHDAVLDAVKVTLSYHHCVIVVPMLTPEFEDVDARGIFGSFGVTQPDSGDLLTDLLVSDQVELLSALRSSGAEVLDVRRTNPVRHVLNRLAELKIARRSSRNW